MNIRNSTIFNFNIIDHKCEYVHLLCHRIDYSFLISLHWRTISLYWCVQRLHWAICCQFDISPTHYNTSVFVQGPTPRRPRLHHVGMYCMVVHGCFFYEDLLSLNQWTFLYVRLLYWKSQWHSKRKKTIMKLYIFGHSSIYTIWFWYWNYVNCKWSFRLFE